MDFTLKIRMPAGVVVVEKVSEFNNLSRIYTKTVSYEAVFFMKKHKLLLKNTPFHKISPFFKGLAECFGKHFK